MALLLKNSIFYHVPKTGGTWVRHIINLNNLAVRELGSHHYGRAESLKSFPKIKNKFAFGFIRNPLSWYISRWSMAGHRNLLIKDAPKKRQGISTLDAVSTREANNINVWVSRVLTTQPSYYTNLAIKFFCPEFDQVDFIGRYENLADDFLKAMRLGGETIEHFTTEAKNAGTNEYKALAERQLKTKTLKLIREHEHVIFSHFNYSSSFYGGL